jgi:excisionase family DNA binding protein
MVAAIQIEPLLTPKETAARLHVSEMTVYNLARRGALPRVLIGRAVRYNPADLQAYLERSTVRGVAVVMNTPSG